MYKRKEDSMTTRKSIIMLNDIQTSEAWIVVGDKIRSDTFFGYTDGLQTISVQYTEFTGIFRLQGTLSNNPTSDEDWFTIIEKSYPVEPMAPTGQRGDTGIEGFPTEGNFLYLRAVMDRNPEDIEPDRQDEIDGIFGKINKVLVAL